MTRQEAIKILDLNAGRLSNSVQMAISTLMKDGEKIKAIKEVLEKRRGLLEKAIEYHKGDEWLEGKECGYSDALDLLNSTVESIRIEL